MKSKRGSTAVWITIIFILVVIGAVTIIYLVKNQDKDILDTLNKCQVVETQNSEYGDLTSISCNLVCENFGKTCIRQDYGSYREDGWVFDTGGDCSVSYGHINNINEIGGSKLHCTCC